MTKHRDPLTDSIEWPRDGWRDRLAVPAEAAQAIAEQLDLQTAPDDLSLTVDADLSASGKELVYRLSLSGTVTQACVVTLEALKTTLDESFIRRFREDSFRDELEVEIAAANGDIATLNEDLEPWPRTVDERPSLLDFVVEHLGLILDPYPRKQGTEADAGLLQDPVDQPETMSPFAALASLKPKSED